MKMRFEPSGVHYYCRKSGTHILLDEIQTSPSYYSLAPRTVSIAITNECDFRCSYCYVNLSNQYLSKEDIISYCLDLDKLGTFDVAFGGGEPLLHPDIIEICQTIWKTTKLGISITTHGHHLNEEIVDNLKDYVSFIRVSIDGIEPIYSKLRKKPLVNLLSNLKLLDGKIPFGFNTVITKLNLEHLDDLKELFKLYNSFELLLLPMWHKGKYVLSSNDWKILENWIIKNHKDMPIRISSSAKQHLNLSYLFDDQEWDNDYAFIGIDKTFRKDSFTKNGLIINEYENFESLLRNWRG